MRGNTHTMKKQTNTKKDLTKKDLIKILDKIDSEQTKQGLKEYSATKKNLKD